jgi:hypothetical protein
MKLLPLLMFCGGPLGETLTGWLSDEGCAKGRVASGVIKPNNPECVKQCLDKGSRAVFMSEQGQEMLFVTGYKNVQEDVGYHIEITGVRDGKNIAVQSVKRIGEYQGPACARPTSKTKK